MKYLKRRKNKKLVKINKKTVISLVNVVISY